MNVACLQASHDIYLQYSRLQGAQRVKILQASRGESKLAKYDRVTVNTLLWGVLQPLCYVLLLSMFKMAVP